MSGYRSIVVPVDFSAASEAAWRRAQELAAPGATIGAGNVATPPYPDVAYANIPAAVREQRAENELRIARMTATASVRVEHRVLAGDVTEKVLDAIRELPADLVVAGTHAHHGLERLLRGSVAESLVRHAPCDVLLVKGP